MATQVFLLGRDDTGILSQVAPDVFDGPLRDDLVHTFLEDDRHVMAVAVDDAGTVVGLASGVRYLHPDKPDQLFINEVVVAPSHQGQGIGRDLMNALLAEARRTGCTEAWVLTSEDNAAARALYEKAGGVSSPDRIVMYTFALAGQTAGDGEP